MKILIIDYIYLSSSTILKNTAIAFSTIIEAIDSVETLKKRYPNATMIHAQKNAVLYAGFINSHVHLEFSSNQTHLKYGSFMPWLHSVIENREEILKKSTNQIMHQACQSMLSSGITSFGAISSFGMELEVCEETPQRVVFFNELIGSNAMVADMLFNDFKERLEASKQCDKSANITPAIAIHAPYSVHPILLQKAVNIAKKEKLPLCAHLLESQAEREWLEEGKGEFKPFFQNYFKTATPVSNIQEFLSAFDSYPTHFTHCCEANAKELNYLSLKNHSIAHCPRSNRYLGSSHLPIENLNLPFSLATDGLSSNDSLNIFDELKSALFLHHHLPIHKLASNLIESITTTPAKILGLNCGELKEGKFADFTIVSLPDTPIKDEDIALWTILHTHQAQEVYIGGEKVI